MHTTSAGLRHSDHQMEVAAPARQLYDLVADAAAGPLVFPGTVHVEWLNRTAPDQPGPPAAVLDQPGPPAEAAEETLRIWALNGTTARRWTSRRLLDPARLSVTFQQERPDPPVGFMRGRWQMKPVASARTLVTLSHDYRATDDEPDATAGGPGQSSAAAGGPGQSSGAAWIEDLVDRVSGGQLQAMREFAAYGQPIVLEETADLDCPVDAAYALAQDCDAWSMPAGPARPAVTRWPLPDLQVADLIVAGRDGGPRAGRLARVCFPGSHIAFKDMLPAPPIAAQIGSLRFSSTPGGSRVEVRELVVLSHDSAPAGTTITGALLARLKALR